MCYSPITIKVGDEYKKVPCGHCLECLKKYQNDWTNRMNEELKANDGKAVFFTLTYAEDRVPKNYLYDYQIYRSPSDYGYTNAECVSTGKRKLSHKWKSVVRGEKLKFWQVPWQELLDLGLDLPDIKQNKLDGKEPNILHFNITRNNHQKFIENVQRIYGDYYRIVSDTLPFGSTSWSSDSTREYDMDDVEDWFENYEGDLFTYDDVDMTADNFSKVLNDDTYTDTDGSSYNPGPVFGDTYRERPIMSFNSVRKKDVQNWLKRGRDKLARQGKHFTYFITSEYGPRTLRPHYHGVVFGITEEEFRPFVQDWTRHYGFVSAENVDLSKGDMSYCAKYCSKGAYEHPLCSRDFFYTHKDGTLTEYHSKHYERCLELFGIDEPIVDRTFHLMSKGLGEAYAEDMKDYFVGDFSEYQIQHHDLASTPTIKVERLIAPWDEGFSTSSLPVDKAGFKYKIIENKQIENEPDDYERRIEDLIQRFKYRKITPQGKVISYGMPQYYRTKVFSDEIRAAFAAYVQAVNVAIYREKLELVRAEDPTREDAENVLILEEQERRDLARRKHECYERMQRTYNKSKI